jgi:hypothetical protein
MFRMFGDGLAHARPVASNQSSRRQFFIGTTAEVRADRLLAVEQPRKLAERQAMPNRHRHVAIESDGRGILHRTLDIEAVDRIRPVEHDDADASPGGLFEHVRRSWPGYV